MPEAHLYSATAQRKGSFALPVEFDGAVNQSALYHAVRAYLNNQRQGTHSTKSRGEVSGGNRKPWRQKGTGRARHGSTRSPLWPGGGIVFGPKPRTYRTELPRKVKRLARQSALNARAGAGDLYVIEALDFERPQTRRMVELLDKLGLGGRKVLVLTAGPRESVYLSGRNLPDVHVMPYADASAYDLLWSDALLIEESAIGGGQEIAGAPEQVAARGAARRKPAKAAAKPKAAGRAVAKQRTAAKAPAKKPAKRAGTKTAKTPKRKGGTDA